ncbi:MAG: GNAT family N-acetyltransferase [Roseovarius sp.]|nr:GNAT family N-acetyltransferase [Roseovarius sp.]
MLSDDSRFIVRLAETEEDILAAQRLRYEVFVKELGGDGPLVDHDRKLERDKFDPFFDHLILKDRNQGENVVGAYRVLRDDQAENAGQFYSEDEYDLSILKKSKRKLMELGRSCVASEYRGGEAMYHLWSGLAAYVIRHKIDILFGVASFHGTNLETLAKPLSLLHHRHLAPENLRVKARGEHFQRMDLVDEPDLDNRRTMLEIPALIKAYLRLGGFVGEGAYIDREFNTIDVCLVIDTSLLNHRQKLIYSKGVED